MYRSMHNYAMRDHHDTDCIINTAHHHDRVFHLASKTNWPPITTLVHANNVSQTTTEAGAGHMHQSLQ